MERLVEIFLNLQASEAIMQLLMLVVLTIVLDNLKKAFPVFSNNITNHINRYCSHQKRIIESVLYPFLGYQLIHVGDTGIKAGYFYLHSPYGKQLSYSHDKE